MKVENYKVPHSSFLSMEKDLNQITGSMLRNKNLKKLLRKIGLEYHRLIF